MIFKRANAAAGSVPSPGSIGVLSAAAIVKRQAQVIRDLQGPPAKPFNRLAQKFAKGRTNRHVPGQMNKTEERYHAHLAIRLKAGEILQFGFEEFTLKLAKDLRYTPDFWVQLPDGVVEFHETKGSKKHTIKDAVGAKVKTGRIVPYFGDEGAKPKLAVAAAKFPFRFVVVFEDKAGGRWLTEEYSEPEPLEIEAPKDQARLFGSVSM